MFEKIKQHKAEIAYFTAGFALTALACGVTYVATRQYYHNAFIQMNKTAEAAGVLETLIEYQNSH